MISQQMALFSCILLYHSINDFSTDGRCSPVYCCIILLMISQQMALFSCILLYHSINDFSTDGGCSPVYCCIILLMISQQMVVVLLYIVVSFY